jgi:predicted transcriptional regulator of viral defense system
LVHHGSLGHFERVSRGFYRLREFPALPHEDVIAAWVKAGTDHAVVSHETALSLYELAPIRPKKIHITVPRAHRPYGDQKQLPSVQIHTTAKQFKPHEIVQRFGVRVTSSARTIVDSADLGTEPSFIIEAVRHALEGGVLTREELKQAARERSERVRKLVDRAIKEEGQDAKVQ